MTGFVEITVVLQIFQIFPEEDMKKEVIIIILVLLFIQVVNISAATDTWTIKNTCDLYWKTFTSRDGVKMETGIKVMKGTIATPLARITLKYLKIKLPTGEIGYVDYMNIVESNLLINKKEIDFVFGDHWILRARDDQKKTLPIGTEAYYLETQKNGGIYKVRLKDGTIGCVIRGHMLPKIFDDVPEVHQTNNDIYRYDKLVQKLEHMTSEQVFEEFGEPSALVYLENNKAEAFYRYIIAVKDKKRYEDIKFHFVNDKVVNVELLGKGKNKIVEKLPFANFVRGFDFNKLASRDYFMKKNTKKNFFDKFKQKNWITKIIGIIITIFLIFLFFSIPQFIFLPFFFIFAFMKFFPNGFVKFLNFIFLTAFYYAAFLFLTLHIVLTQPLIYAIGTVFCYIIYVKWNYKTISYNRCPRCRGMWTATGRGTTKTGENQETQKVERRVYKGRTTSSSGQKTDHYDQHWDDEVTTREHFKDHRKCRVCSYDWDVDRTESSKETHYH